MTSAKRGKHVWQCNICGYWSPRAKNVERHTISIHAGAASVLPAYATLVVEPSYKITLLGPPSAPLIAHDTHLFSTGLEGSTGAASMNDPIEAIKRMNSYLDRALKPAEEFQEICDRFQRLRGERGGGGYGSPVTFQQAAAAIPTFHTSFGAEGYTGMICDKCFALVIAPIPLSARPEDFKPSIESAHICKGERTFPSETARRQEMQQAQSSLIDTLFAKVKEWLKDKNLVLRLDRLDGYAPQPSTLIHEIILEINDLSTQQVAEVTSIDETQLKAFLTEVHSTIGIFKITDASKVSRYYRCTVWGLPRVMPRTAPTADDESTSNNDGKVASSPAAVAKNTRITENGKMEKEDAGQHQDAVAAALKEIIEKERAYDPASRAASGTGKVKTETTTSSSFRGVKLALCEDCCNAYVTLITIPQDLKFERLFHVRCPGRAKFESEDARLDYIKRSEANALDGLVEIAKMYLSEGKTALHVKKIEPPNPHLKGYATPYGGKELGYYIPRAAKDATTLLDEKELRNFLAHNKATCGYYEMLPSGEQYFASVVSVDQINESEPEASTTFSSHPSSNSAEATITSTKPTTQTAEKDANKTLDSREEQ